MLSALIVSATGHAGCVQLRYRYRLYPSPGQMHALARVFGCARVVFNDALRARQEACAAGLPYISDVVMSAATGIEPQGQGISE